MRPHNFTPNYTKMKLIQSINQATKDTTIDTESSIHDNKGKTMYSILFPSYYHLVEGKFILGNHL